MLKEKTVHKTITDETKARIAEMEVVLPSRYSMVFSEVASEFQVDLGREAYISNELIEDKVLEHAIHLGDNATKAVGAMQSKNDKLLLEVINETLQLREEIESLRSAVYEDALTGVFNRKWFQDHFVTSEGTHLTKEGIFVIVDMNDFKFINDTFGHVSGDKVLIFIASQLKRSGGKVIRYGGDEFCVLFEDENEVKAVNQKMHIIRETVIKQQLKVDDKRFKTSFSYGATAFHQGDELADIIEAADQKMYNDKVTIKERLRQSQGV